MRSKCGRCGPDVERHGSVEDEHCEGVRWKKQIKKPKKKERWTDHRHHHGTTRHTILFFFFFSLELDFSAFMLDWAFSSHHIMAFFKPT